jgi:hypothetical protein
MENFNVSFHFQRSTITDFLQHYLFTTVLDKQVKKNNNKKIINILHLYLAVMDNFSIFWGLAEFSNFPRFSGKSRRPSKIILKVSGLHHSPSH